MLLIFATLLFFSIPQPDPIYEEIHDSNAIYGCMGPGHVLHRPTAVFGRISAGREELCYLQMGQRAQVHKVVKHTLPFLSSHT